MVHTADASAGSVTVSCGFVNSDARRRRSERNIQGRMQGDDALSSTAALIFRKFIARYADNFSMKRRSSGRQFKSALVRTSVSRVSDIAENRSKSTRVRAICDRALT